MSRFKSTTAAALRAHYETMKDVSLAALFAQNPQRCSRLCVQFDGIWVDYSKNHITEETMRLLIGFAKEANITVWRDKMFAGEPINHTEQRSVLHTALRNSKQEAIVIDGDNIVPHIRRVKQQMRHFSDAVRTQTWRGHSGKPITDIVNIGIGGSDLGPCMAVEALKYYGHKALRMHFVSNIDGAHIHETLAHLSAETTLFIIASKTFTTQETLTNAHTARSWLLAAYNGDGRAVNKHVVAVSTNRAAAIAFGIDPQHIFEFWDWVGGRYSLWSAVGLSIALAIGMDEFDNMLRGAEAMDTHFLSAPISQNIPCILALLGIWYNNFFGAHTHAILPYAQALHRLPAYLQQADMESNGKSVTRLGAQVDYPTGSIVWGEPGTNGQHAFYQLLHQGTHLIPADFIGIIHSPYAAEHHTLLMSHFFAQTEALMVGRTSNKPHQAFAGNKPSTSILLEALSPYHLGALLAMYEHKIFVQGIMWEINSYDQWGVQLGKELANTIAQELMHDKTIDTHDASTNHLINTYKQIRKKYSV